MILVIRLSLSLSTVLIVCLDSGALTFTIGGATLIIAGGTLTIVSGI